MLTKKMFDDLSLMPVWEMTDKELSQLRRSSRTSSKLLEKVVYEQADRGLLKPWSRSGYPPEKKKKISDYVENKVSAYVPDSFLGPTKSSNTKPLQPPAIKPTFILPMKSFMLFDKKGDNGSTMGFPIDEVYKEEDIYPHDGLWIEYTYDLCEDSAYLELMNDGVVVFDDIVDEIEPIFYSNERSHEFYIIDSKELSVEVPKCSASGSAKIGFSPFDKGGLGAIVRTSKAL